MVDEEDLSVSLFLLALFLFTRMKRIVGMPSRRTMERVAAPPALREAMR